MVLSVVSFLPVQPSAAYRSQPRVVGVQFQMLVGRFSIVHPILVASVLVLVSSRLLRTVVIVDVGCPSVVVLVLS